MDTHFQTTIKGILAGLCISIGCRVFLMTDKVIGAILFTVGLITILFFDFNLYTGKVCYIPNKTIKIKTVLFILLGNIIGTALFGFLLPLEQASVLWQAKMELNLFEVFIKSILCNILIYIAVDGYKNKKSIIPTIYCIPTFILSGYEHSIADLGYFFMARQFNLYSIVFLLVVIIGNAIGGMLIPIMKKEFLKNDTSK